MNARTLILIRVSGCRAWIFGWIGLWRNISGLKFQKYSTRL